MKKKNKNNLIVLRLLLVVSEQARPEHEKPHVDERAPDLPPPVADHPPFVHHLRRHRFCSERRKETPKSNSEMENLADSEGSSDWQSFASARSARDLSDLIAHTSVLNFRGPVNRKIQVSFRQRTRNSQTGIGKFRRRKSYQNSKFWLTSKGS
jgi:hypothetical protein